MDDERRPNKFDFNAINLSSDKNTEKVIKSSESIRMKPNMDSFNLASGIQWRNMDSKQLSLNSKTDSQDSHAFRSLSIPKTRQLKLDFSKLLKLLLLLFKGWAFNTEDLRLSYLEFKILKAILLRKMMLKLKGKDMEALDKKLEYIWQKKDLEELAGEVISIAKKLYRRAEEKYKFVFKMVIKLQMQIFFETNPDKASLEKKEKMQSFWQFYFGDYCEKNGINIEHLYDPLNRRILENPKWKALTSDYLRLLYGNSDYKKYSIVVMQEDIADHYMESIEVKFTQILDSIKSDLTSPMNRNFGEAKQEEVIKKRILKAGTKIPWTSYGIDNAVTRFLKQLTKLKVLTS